jgi:eukaryotic-like serine/threonine-protein kinase
MKPKDRLNKLLSKRSVQITLVVATVFLLVFFLVDNVVMPIYTRQGSEKPIPNLVGMTWEQAAQAAAVNKFQVIALPGKMSSDVPEGAILEQMPAAGSLAKGGRKIHITPAIAPNADSAPDLMGLDLRAAQFKCKSLGLVCGSTEVSYRFSSTVPKGNVLGQKPKVGQDVKPGSSIYITVSLGPEPSQITIPSLIEQTLHDARSLLLESGLQVGKITRKETDAFPAGTVIAQSIRTGEDVAPGTAVDLVIAIKKGKEGKSGRQTD